MCPRAWQHFKRRCPWECVKGTTRHGHHDPKRTLARRLHMVREGTWPPSEGAICAWMAAYEAVGLKRVFLFMWWSSRRLVFRGYSESSYHVNDISRIHCSQHLLTTDSERSN
ncbi:uncharacterized protein TNCV_4484711 [Trichonephila clavipes]|nr:uncharacterized protein TNCV_4484711 [Trichonephila clavipes]